MSGIERKVVVHIHSQKTRKALLLFSLLLFPVTLYYLSPYLIIQGSFAGIVSGSCALFTLLFVSSLFFGRAFCGWLCPAGALQDNCAQIVGKPASRKQNLIKYFIWVPWLITIIAGFISAGGIKQIDILYFTKYGISVSEVSGYIMYYFVLSMILIVSLLFGRRSFCHSMCWIAPFMIIGSKLKNRLGYTSLHLEANAEKCIACKRCDKNCPMSLNVSEMVRNRKTNNSECILCGTCVQGCPENTIHMGVKRDQP